jgi:type II secretory pathway pseudopilin PulG
MKKKKAFTVIEVLIAFSIFVIVMGILFPFFISSYKSFNNTAIKSELQDDAEKAMKSLSKIAMEAKKVSSIGNSGVDKSSQIYIIEGINIKTIEFLSGDDEINKFELDKELLYKVSPTGDKTNIGKNIDYIEVSPLQGFTFDKSQGIKIVLNMKKKDIKYTMNNILYFRNKASERK